MMSSDSTIVYYLIEDGIGQPQIELPEISRDEKREKIDANLRKHQSYLEQSALYGIPITLSKKSTEKHGETST